MTSQTASAEKRVGKCLLDNWVEERAAAVLDTDGSRVQIQKHGHRGILTVDLASKIEGVSTERASYIPPRGPGVRERGIRGELLEKHITQKISEKVHAEFSPAPPKTDFRSTTQKDFIVEGFVPLDPEPTNVYDYKTDQAVTFWSENHQRVQGVSAVRTSDTPFKKTSMFSTPVTEQLDQLVLPPEN
ncbi:sperm-associated antigen 8 [Centroberyx affinis]|uniref:sperm-associated antigen 8 n=1 Tax=Centroberyx affinis TaxID=166261 RepID=UPI003A5C2CBC